MIVVATVLVLLWVVAGAVVVRASAKPNIDAILAQDVPVSIAQTSDTLVQAA